MILTVCCESRSSKEHEVDPQNKKEAVAMITVRRKVRKFTEKFKYFVMSALALTRVWPSFAVGQDNHSHTMSAQQELTAEQKSQQSALIKMVRESTERFKDVGRLREKGMPLVSAA